MKTEKKRILPYFGYLLMISYIFYKPGVFGPLKKRKKFCRG
jgi:hypothetical protein